MLSKRILLLLAGLVLIMGGLYLYYIYDPAHAHFAPKCMFRMLTGWDCPSCGTQRALHALLHGDVCAAVRYNPFALCSLPYVAALAYTTFATSDRARRWRRWVQHPYTVILYLVLLIAWWILRNTPIWL